MYITFEVAAICPCWREINLSLKQSHQGIPSCARPDLEVSHCSEFRHRQADSRPLRVAQRLHQNAYHMILLYKYH